MNNFFKRKKMKILIDIGHPAHVHYFKNFIKIMQKKGNIITVSARDRECVSDLLVFEEIPFFRRGKGFNGIFGKFLLSYSKY